MPFKCVIPAAGFGTRMLPAAKAVPKELLPILDRPTIQHVVEEAAAAGVTEALLITSRQKTAIEEHFQPNPELNARLAAAGRSNLLSSLHALTARVKIQSVHQPQMRGLGDAVRQAKAFCAADPFLCMLGDAIFIGEQSPAAQLSEAFARFKTPIIGLERVPEEKCDRYGIAAGTEIESGVIRVESLVEKPPKGSGNGFRLAIAARYVLTPAIFEMLEEVQPDARGEIQLTDAIAKLMQRGTVHGVILNSTRHDIGDLRGWLTANIAMAARDPQLRAMLMNLL